MPTRDTPRSKKSLSRRAFLGEAATLPFQLGGLSHLLGHSVRNPGFWAAAVSSSALTACGETKISGPTETETQNPLKPKSSLDNEGKDETSQTGGRASENTNEEPSDDGSSFDDNTPPDSPSSADVSGKGSTKQKDQTPASGSKVQTSPSLVRGAQPSLGFFSRGAPRLTREQIEAGTPIEATCEGTNHKLLITSEHLQELAQGKTVRVRSETKTHFGNPTVHSHVVTYTPLMG